MDFIKIKINHKIVLDQASYFNDINKYPAPREPEVWLISEANGAIVMFPDRTYVYISAQTFNGLDIEPEPEKPELTRQANSGIIDSQTLLKAIAIAQQPELALNLLKE